MPWLFDYLNNHIKQSYSRLIHVYKTFTYAALRYGVISGGDEVRRDAVAPPQLAGDAPVSTVFQPRVPRLLEHVRDDFQIFLPDSLELEWNFITLVIRSRTGTLLFLKWSELNKHQFYLYTNVNSKVLKYNQRQHYALDFIIDKANAYSHTIILLS